MPSMVEERVFLSYVRENRSDVEAIVSELRTRGFDVWYDREALRPGTFWKHEITTAIRSGASFIACFSAEYNARDKTYMNEELAIAVEEIRLRGNSPWFIPAKLSDEVPDLPIGAGRSLRDIQFVNLAVSNRMAGIEALVRSLKSFRNADTRSMVEVTTSSKPTVPEDMGLTTESRSLIELAGAGQTATKEVTLDAGFYRVSLEHHGRRNFIVKMLESGGVSSQTLVNKVGRFHGAKAIRVQRRDSFVFDVAADGPWIIRIATPAVISSDGVFTGSEQAATDLFHLRGGLRVFRLSHHGRSNFIVRLLDQSGQSVETLLNDTGEVDASKPVRVSEGYYALDLDADGEWVISHE